jgi:hypothetical protein
MFHVLCDTPSSINYSDALCFANMAGGAPPTPRARKRERLNLRLLAQDWTKIGSMNSAQPMIAAVGSKAPDLSEPVSGFARGELSMCSRNEIFRACP